MASARRNTTKSLSPARSRVARDFIRDVIERDFEGNINAAAKKWEVSQSSLSDFLNGQGGVGLKVLEAVADYSRVLIDQITGRVAFGRVSIDASKPPVGAETVRASSDPAIPKTPDAGVAGKSRGAEKNATPVRR